MNNYIISYLRNSGQEAGILWQANNDSQAVAAFVEANPGLIPLTILSISNLQPNSANSWNRMLRIEKTEPRYRIEHSS